MRLLIKIQQFITAIFMIIVSPQFVYLENTILLNYLQPPPTPTLISPLHNADKISPRVKFVWNSSTGAEFYRIKIWESSWCRPDLIFVDSTLTDTTFQIGTLKFNKEYRWCVSARNDSGSSSFSPIRRFTTHHNDAPKIVVPITVRNNTDDKITMHFGVAVGATYCIDEEFGEYELPPIPPGFDFLFVDHRRGAGSCLGPVGVWLHLQGWEKYVKRDTFRVSFHPGGGGLPLKFSWSQNLNEFYDSLEIRIPYPTTVINMLTDSSLIIDDDYINTFRIIGIPKPYRIPDPPVLVSPINVSDIFGSPNFEWKQTLRAHKYWLQVSTDSHFTTTIINDSTIKTNTYQLTEGLEPFVWHYWRVGAINSEGFSGFSDKWSFILSPCPVDDDGETIKQYYLSQNYPNPFNSQSVVSYEIPEFSYVKLNIYDLLGRERVCLINAYQQAGRYQIKVHSENLSSGVYFYRLETTSINNPSNKFTKSRKLLILK